MMRFPEDLFSNRRYAVLGLGGNGLPAACSLAKMGASVVAWDDRPSVRESAQHFATGLGTLSFRDLSRGDFAFDALVLSPGIPHLLPRPHAVVLRAQQTHTRILSDSDLLFMAVRASGSGACFVGITGTNGKSTTTSLLAHILRTAGREVSAGGNLGPAALSLPRLHDSGVYVLEMSSYMLDQVDAIRFDAAAMLNVSPDHLDRHGNMGNYAHAKRTIFRSQNAGDLAVVGIDDPVSQQMAAWLRTRAAHVTTISSLRRADVWCECGILRDESGVIMDMKETRYLHGVHNAQNAAAAEQSPCISAFLETTLPQA